MVRTTPILAVLLFVEGCAFVPEFIPTTMRGAECKGECVIGEQSFRANSYVCNNGYAGCISLH